MQFNMLNVVKMAKRLKRAETPPLDSAAARLVKRHIVPTTMSRKPQRQIVNRQGPEKLQWQHSSFYPFDDGRRNICH